MIMLRVDLDSAPCFEHVGDELIKSLFMFQEVQPMLIG